MLWADLPSLGGSLAGLRSEFREPEALQDVDRRRNRYLGRQGAAPQSRPFSSPARLRCTAWSLKKRGTDGRARTSFHCAHWTEDQTIKRKPPTTRPSCGIAVAGGLALKCECIPRRRMAICLPRLLSPSFPVAAARSVWPMIRQVAAQLRWACMPCTHAWQTMVRVRVNYAALLQCDGGRRDCMTAHGGFDFTAE